MSSSFAQNTLLGRFARFTASGAVGTLGHYTMLVGLVEGGGLSPVVGTSGGFVAGALINYALNYRFTFRSRRRHREALTRFLLIAALGAVINGAIMQGLHGGLGLHYFLAQLAATTLVLIWNFAASSLWAFREVSHECRN